MEIKPCINCGGKARKTKKSCGNFKCKKCKLTCSYNRFSKTDEICYWSMNIENIMTIESDSITGTHVSYYSSFQKYEYMHADGGGYYSNYAPNIKISEQFLLPPEALTKEKLLRIFA